MAVAASSAFPPFLSPVQLDFDELHYEPGSGHDLHHGAYMRRVRLGDGGIYDNLGLETVKQCGVIFVSDGGGKIRPRPRVSNLWVLQSLRAAGIVDDQVRSLRKRHLVGAFQDGTLRGAYWGIRTDIRDYDLTDALPCPLLDTHKLAETPTRLARMDLNIQKKLINWGYAVSDAAVRKYGNVSVPPPRDFPYLESGVG